jgi:hypothetical protein
MRHLVAAGEQASWLLAHLQYGRRPPALSAPGMTQIHETMIPSLLIVAESPRSEPNATQHEDMATRRRHHTAYPLC